MPAALFCVALWLTAAAALLAPSPAALAAPNAPPLPIAVDVETQGCPTRVDLLAALGARLPGLEVAASGTGARRLLLDRPAGQSRARLRLTNPAGAVELERRLELSAAGSGARLRATERCAALAEAAAQVVARYLKEIGYRPPSATVAEPAAPLPADESSVAAAPSSSPVPEPTPAPPPPPEAPVAPVPRAEPPPREAPPPAPAKPAPQTEPATPPLTRAPSPPPPAHPGAGELVLTVGAGQRTGLGSGSDWSRGELTLGLELRRRWLAASLAGGVSRQTDVGITGISPDAGLLLRAYPLRAALGVAVPVGARGTLMPLLGASLDFVTFQSQSLDGTQRGRRFDPAVEAGLAYRHRWGLLVVGARLVGGLTLGGHDFFVERPAPVFQTPGGYLRVLLETGFALGKDS